MIRDTSGQDTLISSSITQRWRKPFALAAVMLAAAGTVVWLGGRDASQSVDASRLVTAKVERGTLIRDVAATGHIVAANAPILYSPQSGHVRLLAQPGDQVEVNQVVAEVNSPELANSLQQQQAVLASLQGELEGRRLDARAQELALTRTLELAKVDLDAAQREERRAQQSMQKQLISQRDFDQAIDELARAKLNYRLAGQEVQIAKDTLAFELRSAGIAIERQQLVVQELVRQVDSLAIRAPVSGIVGNHLVEQMAAVSQSQPLITLVDLSAFEAELQVPESYADELGLGMDVELQLAGLNLIGQLKAISPEVRDRQVTTRVKLLDQPQGLRQNQRLSARILLENRPNTLMVKRGAFLQSGGSLSYRVDGETAYRTAIRTGVSSISHVELLSGAKEGDTLIISSLDPFENQDKVMLR
ncbi:HlyD family efflux transporter periplasmic adaptor subunit [Bowmanella sp. Y26]|uniref:efflux RND transporter periplasmic adaptor subunit n=1 Tax=Bowmanella yangjiangensis TaxID=2811230 RepID=UPI001BDC8F53|nr:HlyD family efflux transporter periplasmic adaptor subunit [Bowmanella yangjiangensis]MBT1064681.1 HlyD family efflux transporter periplasmic adaptor subunit [Bowmanella yangjiangensis]